MGNPRFELLADVMDAMLDAVCVVDRDGHFVFVSAAFERLFGYTPDEVIGKSMLNLVFAEDRERTLRTVDAILGGELKPTFENRWVHKQGRVVHVMWSARWSEELQVRIAVARDITEQKHSQSKQAALYAIAEAAHAAGDVLTLFQRVHQVLNEWLPAMNFFVALKEHSRAELALPYCVVEFNHNLENCRRDAAQLASKVIASGRSRLLARNECGAIDDCDITKISETATLETIAVPLPLQNQGTGALLVQNVSSAVYYSDKDVELLQFVATQVANAVARKQMEEQLQHMAGHDQLTDLPNRALFHDRFHMALAQARRDHTPLALLFIDLDNFATINDSLGHLVGDGLLQNTAARLRDCIREADSAGRIGGDEFLVLLSHFTNRGDVDAVADKIRTTLGLPHSIGNHLLTVTPSIGIAFFPEHGHDYQQLIKRADAAMYRAKRAGGNRIAVVELALD